MKKNLCCCLLLINIAAIWTKEEELPLCPTNMHYFPQNLPMHCRMPANFPTMQLQPQELATVPPFVPPFYQSPPPDGQPSPIPMALPPGIPGPMPFPGPMPMMPMPGPGPAHKLPVIVMPFYSPDPAYKKPGIKKKKKILPRLDSDTDTSFDTDTSAETLSDTSGDTSSDRGWWKKKRFGIGRRSIDKKLHKKHRSRRSRRRNKRLLTPLLQYITEDGYVIFEKKISKDEATDWLNVKSNDENEKDNIRVPDKELQDLNKRAHKETGANRFVEVEEINTKVEQTDTKIEEGKPKLGKVNTDQEEIVEKTTRKPHVKKHHQRFPKIARTRPSS